MHLLTEILVAIASLVVIVAAAYTMRILVAINSPDGRTRIMFGMISSALEAWEAYRFYRKLGKKSGKARKKKSVMGQISKLIPGADVLEEFGGLDLLLGGGGDEEGGGGSNPLGQLGDLLGMLDQVGGAKGGGGPGPRSK